MVEINQIDEEAKKQIQEERTKKAVERLKVLYKKEADAKQVVANIGREIADAKAAIGEGNI